MNQESITPQNEPPRFVGFGSSAAAEVLAENQQRIARLSLPFDPVTGYNSLGRRFRLTLPDFIIREQYLPEPMLEEELIITLKTAGSIAAAAEALGDPPELLAEKLLRLRMLHDFPFWAATTVFIKCKGGGEDVHFILNRPQRRLVERFEAARVAGRPIRLILLKARQWGGSTCAQLYMAWLQLFHSVGLNSLIIAHQGLGSSEIKDMFDRMLASYPAEFLYPLDSPELLSGEALRAKKMVSVGRTGGIFRIPARNCKIKIGTAESPDSCRGGDYNLVHLSEVGIWHETEGKSPEDIVRAACGGVLYRPLTMIVYESTANGTGNFFHREYTAAARGESQFEAMFVAWFEIDQYSIPLSPEEERDLAESLVSGRNSDADTPRSESGRYLWRLFEMGATLQAIKWYVTERAKFSDHADMAAENPSDDIEAFAHSGCRVFDRYAVEALAANCRPPALRGEVLPGAPPGPSNPKSQFSVLNSHPSDLESPFSTLNSRFPFREGSRVVESSALLGAESLDDLHFHPSNAGMEVWALPDSPQTFCNRYLVVVDVGGRSAKADWSVIAVLDRLPLSQGRPPEIVAQWRGHCDFDQLAWRAARIAKFYDEALLVIESNTLETRSREHLVDGDQTPYILLQIEEAYRNLYMRGEVNPKPGFHTNTSTKPMLISTLVQAVRDGAYIERSAEALDELLSYEQRPNGSFGAIAGCHDDMLMTRAIALHISTHEMPFPTPRRPRTPSRQRPPRPDLAF